MGSKANTAISVGQSCGKRCQITVIHRQRGRSSLRAHRSKEEGDDDEPDDVVLEGDEGLLEAEGLGEDGHCDRQERPGAGRQGLQNKPCRRKQTLPDFTNDCSVQGHGSVSL